MQKHTPLAPRGTKFNIGHNPHILRKPVIKGKIETDKLRFDVIDSDGNLHERYFHRIDEENWGDGKWISDANKWRSQTIRRLFKNDPLFKANDTREKWTDEEESYFKAAVLRIAEENRRKLAAKDWNKLVVEHNRKFFGSGTSPDGARAKEEAPAVRTSSGLRTKYKRFPDLIAQVTQIINSPQEDTDNTEIKLEDEKEEKVSVDEKHI